MIESGQETVSGVHIFPFKSCAEATANGVAPQELTISERGFELYGIVDREFVLIDETENFVTQRGWNKDRKRSFPGDQSLSQVAVDIHDEQIQLGHPDCGSFDLPAVLDTDQPKIQCDIFGKLFQGYLVNPEVNDFFSNIVGRRVWLLRQDPKMLRGVSPGYRQKGLANQMAAADGLSFLWTRQATLDDLHKRAGLPIGTKSIRDFRSNIDTDGGLPYAEDYITKIALGGLEARVIKACERCPIPNINQQTGETDGLSTKLLARTRLARQAFDDPEAKRKPMFGVMLNHLLSSIGAVVRVGDQVEIKGKNSLPNITGLP